MDRYYKKRLIPLTLPAFILFIAVVFIPFVVGVLYSFTGWRGTYFNGGGAWYESFVGFENYAKVFSNKKFISALFYTVVFTLASVAVVNIISILMALLANSVKEGGGIYRTIYFVPNLLGGLALGYIWQFVFEIIFSKMLFGGNSFLQIPLFQNMLQDKWKAMLALVIVVTWQWAGYMMLIYTVGLNNISPEYIEAAKIDGASNWKIFWKIKVPLLMPSFTIALFLVLSRCFMLLDQNVALTDGNFGTRTLATQILRTTSDTRPPDYGLAQAQAVVFFVIIAAISLIQVKITSSREVEM